METINITNARANFFHLIDDVIHGSPKCIQTKHGNAIIVSLDEWEGLQETLHIMSDKKFYDEIKDRMETPVSEYIDELDW